MPSRCIFFFSALRAWSMLLSRTMICKGKLRFFAKARLISEGLKPVYLWKLTVQAFDPFPAAPHISAMAILKIARMGHPVLAQIAQPVADPTAPEIRHLVNDMVETMMDANGAGLAA